MGIGYIVWVIFIFISDGILVWLMPGVVNIWAVGWVGVYVRGRPVCCGGLCCERGRRVEKWPETGEFLRDGIASGRGVHRKMGVLIQKSRSNFKGKSGKSRIFGILGVGVV